MSANILRKTTALLSNQTRLTFGSNKKSDSCEMNSLKELSELSLEVSVIKIEINNRKQMAGKCVGEREEEKGINEIPIQTEQIEVYFCELCERDFAHKSSWYRHMKEHREAKPTVYLKHDKINGKYDCFECHKQYLHTRDLKKHLLKAHKKDIEVENHEVELKLLNKGKARGYSMVEVPEQARELEYVRKARNQMTSEITKMMIKIQSKKIPVLAQIDLDTSLQSYLILEDSFDKKVINDHQYAYKVYPFNYLLSDDKYKMEFTNEYQLLTQAKFKECSYLIKLDAVLIVKDHVTFRLPLYEITLRDFITDQRNHKQLGQIATQTLQGIKELHKLGFVHRDLKPENIMINLLPVRVAIIDFNRTQRVAIKAWNCNENARVLSRKRILERWRLLMECVGISSNNHRVRYASQRLLFYKVRERCQAKNKVIYRQNKSISIKETNGRVNNNKTKLKIRHINRANRVVVKQDKPQTSLT